MKSIPTEYAGSRFRSRLEARWAAFFDLAGWDWDYEPFDLEGWCPDFCLHMDGADVLVEVKPVQLVRHEVGSWTLPKHPSFEKARAHQSENWILLLGTRPQDDSDYFGIGTLMDPPHSDEQDITKYPTWWDLRGQLSVRDEVYAWREAGNLVQWVGKR